MCLEKAVAMPTNTLQSLSVHSLRHVLSSVFSSRPLGVSTFLWAWPDAPDICKVIMCDARACHTNSCKTFPKQPCHNGEKGFYLYTHNFDPFAFHCIFLFFGEFSKEENFLYEF